MYYRFCSIYSVFKVDCSCLQGDEGDYVMWLAHSEYGSDSETDGCVLGYKETFRRLRKLSACRNGRGYVVSKQQSPCPCTREDYMW